jgi:hypothetical protein
MSYTRWVRRKRLYDTALLRGSDLFPIAGERSDYAIPSESVLTNVDKVVEGANEHPFFFLEG